MNDAEAMAAIGAQLTAAGWTGHPTNDVHRTVTAWYPPGQPDTDTRAVHHQMMVLRDTVPTRNAAREWTGPTRWNALFFRQEPVRAFGDRGTELWSHTTFDITDLLTCLDAFHTAITADPDALAVFSALNRR